MKFNLFLGIFLGILSPLSAQIKIDSTDSHFFSTVQKELDLMRTGQRGVVSQELVKRLDQVGVMTEIKPITADPSTWHPNDRKGTRSHVEPQDTKLRGASRTTATPAIIFVHPSRVDPAFSLFKLGTFSQLLAAAMDLNYGSFSGNFQIEEKRTIFFRNAWRDSLRLDLISLSDRVPTLEYQNAKKANLIQAENSALFPILNVQAVVKSTPPGALLASPTPAP